MKKIGLVGGISWSSTIDYYRFINEAVNEKLGGIHFAECIIYSVDFNDFCRYNAAHDWNATASLLTNAASQLEKAGAEVLMLCANTAHIVAEQVSDAVGLPLVDIRTATANAILQKGISKAGLLGTEYTMELDFYKNKIQEHGIEVIVPADRADRVYIEETLVQELGKGILREATKAGYIRIANQLIAEGAEAIVLGCTEIPLLLNQDDFDVPVFNTTLIHARAAVEAAIPETN